MGIGRGARVRRFGATRGARAGIRSGSGWTARGTGAARPVPPSQEQLLGRRSTPSSSRPRTARCPAWSQSRLRPRDPIVRQTAPPARPPSASAAPQAYSVMATATNYLPGRDRRLPAPAARLGRQPPGRRRQDLADDPRRPARPARRDDGQGVRRRLPGRRRRARRPRPRSSRRSSAQAAGGGDLVIGSDAVPPMPTTEPPARPSPLTPPPGRTTPDARPAGPTPGRPRRARSRSPAASAGSPTTPAARAAALAATVASAAQPGTAPPRTGPAPPAWPTRTTSRPANEAFVESASSGRRWRGAPTDLRRAPRAPPARWRPSTPTRSPTWSTSPRRRCWATPRCRVVVQTRSARRACRDAGPHVGRRGCHAGHLSYDPR